MTTTQSIEFDTFISNPTIKDKELELKVKVKYKVNNDNCIIDIYELDEQFGIYNCINSLLSPAEIEAIRTQAVEYLRD